LSRSMGIFAEPAAATAFAGFLSASSEHLFNAEEHVVVLITGTGLKDIPSAQKTLGKIKPIAANMSEIETFLKK